MKLSLIALGSSMLLTTSLLLAQTPAALPTPGKPEDLGKGIQRTMSLLATSTPQKHNPVKIVVYGQSISEQKWWEILRDDLKKRFPEADLQMENLAIGGFASQMLIHPLQHDIYASYPDLVIFHVYGADGEYRQIIDGMRRNTAAEVLMQTDHVGENWPDDEATPEKNKGSWWDQHMNKRVLPTIADKYQCGLVDVRSGWVKYLKDNGMEPKALLKDGVHLNDAGCEVMAGFIAQYMVHRPELGYDKTLVTDIPLNPTMWKNGELTIEFVGNRVDIVAGMGEGEAAVLVDGTLPSKHPEPYYITRPSPRPWSAPVTVTRVDHDQPLITESWALTITKMHEDNKNFDFAVSGEKTSADGQGSTMGKFRSNSGRAIIDPAWFFRSDRSGKMAEGQTMTWQVLEMFSDRYVPAAQVDPTRDRTLILAQGLKNGKHTLTLKSLTGGPLAAKAIRAYCPPEK